MQLFGFDYFLGNLFFMMCDVDSFPAKPVLHLVITAYDNEPVSAVLID